MDEALAHWLRLREATDWASRSGSLTREIAEHLGSHEAVHVLDLATGTGSNLRYLVERLPPRQRWLLVDRSPELLSLVSERTAAWATARGYAVRPTPDGFALDGNGLDCVITPRQMDLNLPLDPTLFEGRHLVTGSAILDLVSESWLRELAACCRQAGAAALFALTYNGVSSFTPPEPEDDLIRDLLNAHQLRDKGLGGPAAGPAAHATAEAAFGDAGYIVRAATSRLGHRHHATRVPGAVDRRTCRCGARTAFRPRRHDQELAGASPDAHREGPFAGGRRPPRHRGLAGPSLGRAARWRDSTRPRCGGTTTNRPARSSPTARAAARAPFTAPSGGPASRPVTSRFTTSRIASGSGCRRSAPRRTSSTSGAASVAACATWPSDCRCGAPASR